MASSSASTRLLRRLAAQALGPAGLASAGGRRLDCCGGAAAAALLVHARPIAALATATATAPLPSPRRPATGGGDALHAATLRAHGPGGVRVPPAGGGWAHAAVVFSPPPRPPPDHLRARPPLPLPPPVRPRLRPTTTWAEAGWTRQSVLTLPNFLSTARLASAPLLAHWILAGDWPAAAAGLAAAAVSDWADGAAARGLHGQGSVLGTYLDPLADKAVVCAVAAALAGVGALPAPLAVLVIGRDAALVGGAVVGRLASCGWAWPGGPEFFRLVPARGESGGGGIGGGGLSGGGGGGGSTPPHPALAPPAPAVRPLLLSKVNTALQFGLAGAAIGTAWGGWPGAGAVEGLAWAVAAATAGSGGQYALAALRGAARG
jgi:phosphatidylglycerophosphate synthase